MNSLDLFFARELNPSALNVKTTFHVSRPTVEEIRTRTGLSQIEAAIEAFAIPLL